MCIISVIIHCGIRPGVDWGVLGVVDRSTTLPVKERREELGQIRGREMLCLCEEGRGWMGG